MYESFFGLRERPFELTPNPRFLLLTPRHREALSSLEYGIASRRGLTVVIGDAGTGKTTLLRAVLGRLRVGAGLLKPGPCSYICNPTLTRQEFFEIIARDFSLPVSWIPSKARLLHELQRVLVQTLAAGGSAALVVDEAHSLPHDLLEEIRLLANMETDTAKLLPLVLVGQPELAGRLNQPELRQLKQRIALRCRLEALDAQETGAYIGARLRHAGGDPGTVFTREAVVEIHRRSRGIPRVINVVADNALTTGYALDERPVGRGVVAEVCTDLDLRYTDYGPAESPVLALPDTIPEPVDPPPEPERERPFQLLRGWRAGKAS
jgi:type II secretory pathway predicted ATPase ExeA